MKLGCRSKQIRSLSSVSAVIGLWWACRFYLRKSYIGAFFVFPREKKFFPLKGKKIPLGTEFFRSIIAVGDDDDSDDSRVICFCRVGAICRATIIYIIIIIYK